MIRLFVPETCLPIAPAISVRIAVADKDYTAVADCVVGYCSDFSLKCRNRRNIRELHFCLVIAPLYGAFLQCHIQ